MHHPLLDLTQEWQRQRAQLRAGPQRPPPLVTAGVELAVDPAHTGLPRVQVTGMALIFGLFPATLREFVELARARLRLGPIGSRSELKGVLGSRVQALWAWLPTLQRDCYLELDHATDEPSVWLIGPNAECRPLVLPNDSAELDPAFLAALVLCGSRYWGGRDGLARLVERFGRQGLLVAAQVAESLERQPADTAAALTLAQTRWHHLTPWNESAWEPLTENEPAWVCAQLGRLALRLDLSRAARLLLASAATAPPHELPPSAAYDLGQACEALADLVSAERAYARHATAHLDDADSWRRLLFCRVRLGLLWEADTALKHCRLAGATDAVLAAHLRTTLIHDTLPSLQRANLAGWLGSRLSGPLASLMPLPALVADLAGHCIDRWPGERGAHLAADVTAAVAGLRAALTAADPHLDGEPALLDAGERIALLALPPVVETPAGYAAERIADHLHTALAQWSECALGQGRLLDTPALRAALQRLATLVA